MTTENSSLTRLERILRLLSYLQSGISFDAQELAADFGVHRRTIFRDLNVLRNAGISVHFSEDTEGYTVLPPRSSVRPPRLDDEELAILFASVQLSPLEAITGLGNSAHESMAKMLSSLPDTTRIEMSRLLSSFSTDFAESALNASKVDTLRVIFESVRKRRQIRIEVEDAETQSLIQTKVATYRISYTSGRWQIVGRSSFDRATCTFDVDKITRIELIDEPYTVPRGFRSHS
jgi:predicted DNA-binding transcriptional regulator YafY